MSEAPQFGSAESCLDWAYDQAARPIIKGASLPIPTKYNPNPFAGWEPQEIRAEACNVVELAERSLDLPALAYVRFRFTRDPLALDVLHDWMIGRLQTSAAGRAPKTMIRVYCKDRKATLRAAQYEAGMSDTRFAHLKSSAFDLLDGLHGAVMGPLARALHARGMIPAPHESPSHHGSGGVCSFPLGGRVAS